MAVSKRRIKDLSKKMKFRKGLPPFWPLCALRQFESEEEREEALKEAWAEWTKIKGKNLSKFCRTNIWVLAKEDPADIAGLTKAERESMKRHDCGLGMDLFITRTRQEGIERRAARLEKEMETLISRIKDSK